MSARFAYLDGLRGLAAVNVVAGHAVVAFYFALYTGQAGHSHGGWELAVSSWPLLLPVGGQNFSVCAFLVLSGFVLAHAFEATTLGAAALVAKRFVRLGLPILAATLFAWLLLSTGLMFNHAAVPLTHSPWLDIQVPHGAHLTAALTEGLFGSLIGPWTYDASYNSSLWTMSVEFAGSVLLIGLCRVRSRSGMTGRTHAVWAVAPLALGAALYPCYVSLMLAGAGVQMLGVQRRLARRGLHPAAGPVLAGVAVLLGTIPYTGGPVWDALRAPLPADGVGLAAALRVLPGAAIMDATAVWHGIGALLLLLAVEISPGLRQALSHRLFGVLGRISFPLYLIHLPVLLSVGCGLFLIGTDAGLPYRAAVALAVTGYGAVAFMLAGLAVRLVERPAVRASNEAGAAVDGLFTRRPALPAPATDGSRPLR